MEETPPYQIWITTYEIIDEEMNPTLSHVFYGSTLEEAYGYAESHLITDYFFSASFVGSMPWGTGILQLSNEGEVIHIYRPEDEQETNKIMRKLKSEARKIVREQNRKGILVLIQEVRKQFK